MVFPEALIFDVDGTLADTERDGHRPAFNQAFADAGISWHWDVEIYGRLLRISGGKERMRFYMEDHPVEGLQAQDIDNFIINMHAAKTRIYVDMFANSQILLRPGIERFLKELNQQGTRLAIATTTTRDNVDVLLSSTLGDESLTWFEVIATANEISDKKPSPAVYDYTLEQLGLKAEQCLAFEDSRNGIVAALGAGLNTIITVNDYTREDDFSGAMLIVDQLGEPDKPWSVLGGWAAEKLPADLEYLDLNGLSELMK